ncbi:MAG: hypothetical protein FWH48_09515 [Oscillospiraceae bacterium]|nr:hypothetical protein [Oscillospiraceae bacterium]
MQKNKQIILLSLCLAVVLAFWSCDGDNIRPEPVEVTEETLDEKPTTEPPDNIPMTIGKTTTTEEQTPEPTAAEEIASELSIPEQMEELYKKLDTQKLPTYKIPSWADDVENYDGGAICEQFMQHDETAAMLSNKVFLYLDYEGNMLEDFNDISVVSDKSKFYSIAIRRAPYILGEGLGSLYTQLPKSYPNHVATKLLFDMMADGCYELDKMWYKSDVVDCLVYLFGDGVYSNWALTSNIPDNSYGKGRYFGREEIYATFGSWGTAGGSVPQIIGYEKTSSGYICDVCIYHTDGLHLSDGTTVKITKGNFDEYMAYLPKYRYTFTWQVDGRLILSALETLGVGIVWQTDNGLPRETDESYVLSAYRLFLEGSICAYDEKMQYIDDIFLFNYGLDYAQYAFFDMNGDAIPELHLQLSFDSTYLIFTYENGQVELWHREPGYCSPLNNGAILYERLGVPQLTTYQYIVIDFYGREVSRIAFYRTDDETYSNRFNFNGADVDEETWEALAGQYLSIGSDLIEWRPLKVDFPKKP